jgi:hypothetical protein
MREDQKQTGGSAKGLSLQVFTRLPYYFIEHFVVRLPFYSLAFIVFLH